MELGSRFVDFNSFQVALERYSEENHVVYVVNHSVTVDKKNSEIKNEELHYPAKLKYKYLHLVCKQYGNVRSQGKGLRPHQSTFKTGCDACIRVLANENERDHLYIKKMVTEHNHSTSPNLFTHYPECRRLGDHNTQLVEQLLQYEVKTNILQDVVRTVTGKAVTSKDVHNIRSKMFKKEQNGRSETEELLEELQKLKTLDHASNVYVCPSVETGEIQIIFVQTCDMKAIFEQYSEVLLMDATYNTNNKRMPLITFMVRDGNGKGRVVAYCFLINERKGTVKAAITLLLKSNPFISQTVKTVLVDKDQKSITSLREVLPGADVHLCRFHVMKTFNSETAAEPKESKAEVRKILSKMIYAVTQDVYDTLYTLLKSSASPSFLIYFEKNWHRCPEPWSTYKRVGDSGT